MAGLLGCGVAAAAGAGEGCQLGGAVQHAEDDGTAHCCEACAAYVEGERSSPRPFAAYRSLFRWVVEALRVSSAYFLQTRQYHWY